MQTKTHRLIFDVTVWSGRSYRDISWESLSRSFESQFKSPKTNNCSFNFEFLNSLVLGRVCDVVELYFRMMASRDRRAPHRTRTHCNVHAGSPSWRAGDLESLCAYLEKSLIVMGPIYLMPTPPGAQLPTAVTVPREKLMAFLTTHSKMLSPKTTISRRRGSSRLRQAWLS